MPDATHRAPGFRVTRTDDKTVFHDVPIFAECSRGDFIVDASWVQGAVNYALQRERDGYLPPLHTRHHEEATDYNNAVRAVGVFRITRASPMTYKGQRVLTVFADLIVTDEAMAEELGRMKYPYRSVEIFDPEGPPKIDSLALLDHEAPYLELPMLFAGEVDDQRDPYRQRREEPAGAIPDTGVGRVANATSFTLNYDAEPGALLVCSGHSRKKAALIFRFPDEDTMSETTKTKPANFEADEEKDEEKMEGEGGGNVVDVDAVCKAIEDGSISVEAMDRIIAAIQAQSAASEAPEEEPAGEGAPAPAPGAEVMRAGKGADLAAYAALRGELDATKARLDARDAADKMRADVDEAMKLLDGKVVGSDPRAKLEAFHREVGGNAVAFKAYVAALGANPAPLSDDGGDAAKFGAQPNTPKSAMPYADKGSDALEKAITFSRQYRQLKGMRASEEAYVRVNMERAGYTLEEDAA